VGTVIEEGERRGIILRRPIMPHGLHGYVEPRPACPVTDRLWETAVSVPLYPDLSEQEVGQVEQFLSELEVSI
jgi:dTDP-4-amino-4,6-dideoxygalactose transaminase